MHKPTTRKIIHLQICILLLLLLMTPPTAAAFKHLQEGMPAPEIIGKDIITGAEISSEKLREHNTVVVIFWAGWSKRSLEELEYLKQLAEKHAVDSLKIIAVNVEGQDITPATENEIAELLTQMELPFPCLVDENLKRFYLYGVIAVPSTAIIDSNGVLRYGPAGFSATTRDRILDSVEVLMGLKSITETSAVKIGYVPNNTASRYYRLALNLVNQGLYEQAMDNLDRAFMADSGFSAPHTLRGDVLLKLDSTNAALSEFARAVSLDTSSVAALTGWGKAYLEAGVSDSALSKLSLAVELDSTYTPALYYLSQCLTGMERYDIALALINSALELNPQDAKVYFGQGQVHLKAGDTASAVNAFLTALEILYPAQ